MEKYVFTFEDLDDKIDKIKPKQKKKVDYLEDVTVLNNSKVRVALINNEFKYAQVLNTIRTYLASIKDGAGHLQKAFDFNTMYYDKLMTLYYATMKPDGYFAHIPVTCTIDYKNKRVRGKFNIPKESTVRNPDEFLGYFTEVGIWNNVILRYKDVEVKLHDLMTSETADWNFSAVLPSNIDVPLDADEMELVKGDMIDESSVFMFAAVHKNGDIDYLTPLLFNNYKLRQADKFIFEYLVRAAIE